MVARQLYLAAYDIRNAKRLRAALHVLKDFACGGQKSVFECYLAGCEREELLHRVELVMDPEEDRFLVVPLSLGAVRVKGIAIEPADPDFFYVG